MAKADDIVTALIEDHGTLYSEDIGANIARDEPVQWFHWLVGVQLMSARIAAGNAVQAARALKDEGLHKVDALAQVNRNHLVKVLNENGYARYDNQGADRLRAMAKEVAEFHAGDLRHLRDQGGDRQGILSHLRRLTGIGPGGASIFAREAQIAWGALFPTLEDPAAGQARKLGLPDNAGTLADKAGSAERYTRLVAALTRAALDGPTERVEKVAA